MDNKVKRNKKYAYYYEKLKSLKRKRARAIRKSDKKLEAECNKGIKEIVDLMTINNQMFSKLSEDKISSMSSSKREFKRLMAEKKRYAKMSRKIKKTAQNDDITDSDIKNLNPKEKTPLKIKVGLAVAGLGIVAVFCTGCFGNLFKGKKDSKSKEDDKNLEQQAPTTEETLNDDMEIEYTEKDGAVVKFGDATKKEDNQNENTSTNTNSSTPTASNNSTTSNNNSDNKDNKTEDKNKDNKDNKTEDKNKDNKDNKTEDKNNSDNKDNKTEQDTTNTNKDNNPDLDLDNKEEIINSNVIENTPPANPEDMPIEENQNDPKKDEVYYDENGNIISNDNMPSDNNTNDTNDVPSDNNTNDTDNASSDNNTNDTDNASSENNNETNNSTTTEINNKPSSNMPISEDENDVTYDDGNGKEVSKEDWEKIKSELPSQPELEPNQSNGLIQEYNTIKEELQQLQTIIENQEEQVKESQENTQETQMQEESDVQILELNM